MKTQNTNTATMFELGKVYVMSWIGDSDLKTYYQVVKRTACFVTLVDVRGGKPVRCKVSIYDGAERCEPTGSYSMSPILRADKVVNPTTENPFKLNGFNIVPSDRLAGWFMTTCQEVFGETLNEIIYDVMNIEKHRKQEIIDRVDMEIIEQVNAKKQARIINLF